MKSYTAGAKRNYWMTWSVKHIWKEKGIASQPTSEERSMYLTFIEIQISRKEDMEEVNSLFLMFYHGLTNNIMLLSKWSIDCLKYFIFF